MKAAILFLLASQAALAGPAESVEPTVPLRAEGCEPLPALPALPALGSSGEYRIHLDFRDGRPVGMSLRVLRGIADRREQRMAISHIDQWAKQLRCAEAKSLELDLRISATEGWAGRPKLGR